MTNDTNGRNERPGILGTLSSQTRAIALVALIAEAIFVAGTTLMPAEQRLIAFGICATVLVVAIFACVWIETATSKHARANEPLQLPPELKGSAIVIDQRTSTDTGPVAAIYRTASNFKFAGDYEEAVKHYNAVLALEPGHWKARYNIASCLLYQKEYPAAELQFTALAEDLERAPANRDALLTELLHGCYIQLNRICHAKEDFDGGNAHLRKSLRVKPDDPLSYLNLTISAVRARNAEEAHKWGQILFAHPEHLEILAALSAEDKRALESLSTHSRSGVPER